MYTAGNIDYHAEGETGPMAVEIPFTGRFRLDYGGAPSEDWLARWAASSTGPVTDAHAASGHDIWTQPDGGLCIDCEWTAYTSYSAIDWMVRFTNQATVSSPVLSNIQACAITLPASRETSCRVHTAQGSLCRRDDFAPVCHPLNPTEEEPQAPSVTAERPLVLQSQGGRSSCGALPFLNIDLCDRGVIAAIGWTGDWRVSIWRDDAGSVHMHAGMQRTALRLLPGESVRSPRILLLPWEGDRTEAHNTLRRLLLAHYSPARTGRHHPLPVSLAVWGENEVSRQLAKLSWLREHHVPVDNFWIDAGWHGDAEYHPGANVFNSGWGAQVGNWWPNRTIYPHGLAPVGDAARAADMDFTLWMEPERVYDGTQFTREHPDWLIGPIGGNYLFRLGDPDARAALTDWISTLIAESGVTIYRQDFNMDPAPFWQAADAPDRIGISEIRHIEGLYAFWDSLRERHPGLIIDNCSSGGRRLDLETASRSIPLWRSDYQCFPGYDPAGMQGQTYGLSPWLPLSAGACDHQDVYTLRSAYSPGVTLCTRVNPSNDPEGFLTPAETYDPQWLEAYLHEFGLVAPLSLGDFYPLTGYSLADDVWMGWQWHRPDKDAGAVLLFRRQRCPYPTMELHLHGLSADALYRFENMDSHAVTRLTGAAARDGQLTVTLPDPPQSALLLYRRERSA